MKPNRKDRFNAQLGGIVHHGNGTAYVHLTCRDGTYLVTLWARQFDDAESFDGVKPGPSSHCVIGSFHDYRWAKAAAAFHRASVLCKPLAKLANDERRNLGSAYTRTA